MTDTAIVDPAVPVETTDAPVVPDASTDDAAATKAFSEGFGEPHTDAVPTSTPDTETSDTPTSETTSEPEMVKPEYVQLTKEDWEKTTAAITQLKDQLRHGLDSANGRLGSLQQVVQQRIAATPKGQKVQITAEDFAELKEEFPLLVESQLKGLNRVLEKLSGTGSAQATEPEPTTTAAPAIDVNVLKHSVRQEIAREELTDDHPDWETVVGVPGPNGELPETEFRKWVAAKSEAEQAKIWESWNPRYLAKTLTAFKEHQQQRVANSPKPAPVDDAAARRALLQSGVTPRSAGGASAGSGKTQTEEQAFKEGFMS